MGVKDQDVDFHFPSLFSPICSELIDMYCDLNITASELRQVTSFGLVRLATNLTVSDRPRDSISPPLHPYPSTFYPNDSASQTVSPLLGRDSWVGYNTLGGNISTKLCTERSFNSYGICNSDEDKLSHLSRIIAITLNHPEACRYLQSGQARSVAYEIPTNGTMDPFMTQGATAYQALLPEDLPTEILNAAIKFIHDLLVEYKQPGS
ncbi:hypothetical protein HOY80DRAFT_1000779 [Tuber brumale]|nr:hypothetical protein HOY80DRAFT_1000779 [Tuber brumale]